MMIMMMIKMMILIIMMVITMIRCLTVKNHYAPQSQAYAGALFVGAWGLASPSSCGAVQLAWFADAGHEWRMMTWRRVRKQVRGAGWLPFPAPLMVPVSSF